jgi:hypothetical protein
MLFAEQLSKLWAKCSMQAEGVKASSFFELLLVCCKDLYEVETLT